MVEPVTLDEIKAHLDVARDDQDDMLAAMGVAAREWVENYTGLTLGENTVTQVFDCFAKVGNLLVWPVGDNPVVTVDYIDAAGNPATITAARLWRVTRPARVMPPLGMTWPTDVTGAVAVTVPGVPGSLKAAILLMVGDLYANRETGITGVTYTPTETLVNLCHPYRLPVIG